MRPGHAPSGHSGWCVGRHNCVWKHLLRPYLAQLLRSSPCRLVWAETACPPRHFPGHAAVTAVSEVIEDRIAGTR